ncbi:MAG: sugar phosphate nucleotidyltransferase [Chloroflexota bacterium]
MNIQKAVITIAGKGQRTLPLQTLIDRDGTEKSVLQILIEETLQAGIEEIGLIIRPGDEEAFTEVAGHHSGRLRFIEQKEPLGYGQAILCARSFVESEPFLHLVGDHIYISRTDMSCAQHLVQVAQAENCAVSAVQATRESYLPYFGVVGGSRVKGRQELYQIETILEKPTPTKAEQQLMIPGLRSGHYLCFFGMHVLTPAIMEILDELVANETAVWLSKALHYLAQKEKVLALEKRDWRYDLGAKYGLMNAQLALALNGSDRDLVLTQMIDLMAHRELGA